MALGELPETDANVRESNRRSPRPTRPFYAPRRHGGGRFSSGLTNTVNIGYSKRFMAEAGSGSDSPSFNPTRSVRSSSRGHGPGSAPGRHGPSRVDPIRNSEQLVSEEFGQIGVTGDDEGINFDAYEDIPVEATGEDVPPPVNAFTDLELGKGLMRNIKRCKYLKPTPIQRYALPIAIAGRDLMACAQTGSGKTAAFCFPIISGILNGGRGRAGQIAASPLALILSPTRELACQIHEEAKKFGFQTGLKIVVAYGGAPIYQQIRELKKRVDILVATPGRLVDIVGRGKVSLRMINYLVLDEADRMLDMGFEPQIRKIVDESGMPPPGSRHTMLFSATFPDNIQSLASDFLMNYIFITIGRVGSSTDLIEQKVELMEEMDKRDRLVDLLHSQNANKALGKVDLTLIFVETKRGADILKKWLSKKGFPATAIHGDKMQMEREESLRAFKKGSCPIMVATDVAARGLDIPHIAHVINYDFPRNIDDYVHRIGRTGRAGKSGLATAFFTNANFTLAKALVELMEESKQDIPTWLIDCAKDNSNQFGYRGGRSSGSKFGGFDFRKPGKFWSEDSSGHSKNYYYDQPYAHANNTEQDSSKFSTNYGFADSSVEPNTGDDYHDGNAGSGTFDDWNDTWGTDVKPISSANTGNQDYAAIMDHSASTSYAAYFPPASENKISGYESIVATGWD